MGLGIDLVNEEGYTVYTANITHNLITMAQEADVYFCVWRPDEHDLKTGGELRRPLAEGIARLKGCPQYYAQFEPGNGWGSYKLFVVWLQHLLDACHKHPDAVVQVSR